MTIYRRFYCSCSGTPQEMNNSEVLDSEENGIGEPFCDRCGATPSSDPRHTITFIDSDESRD